MSLAAQWTAHSVTRSAIFFGGGGGRWSSLEQREGDRGQQRLAGHLLVGLHVLLAAEALAACVAEVKAGEVTSLVDLSVVRLGEGPGTPSAVVGLSHGPDLGDEESEERRERRGPDLPYKTSSCS